jgi:ABC-type sugar transport system ATPase subunit
VNALSPPILKIQSARKSFGTTIALADVDLELHPGEVHCLIGENGAGKTTLVNILTGIEQPDSGTIWFQQDEIAIKDINVAHQLGIGVVYQHPVVFPDISVTENMFAGRQLLINRKWWPLVDRRAMRKEVQSVLSRMEIDIDPDATMASLSTGYRQLIEISKALSENVRVLILDEPTASLSEKEVASLFDIIRKLVAQGVAILFISHRIDEIFEIGDRVTVLRDGHKVATRLVSEVDREQVIQMMVGRPLNILYAKEKVALGNEVMRVEGWGRRGVFADISFSLREGEILGLSGLVGSGRTEVARALIGVDQHEAGRLWIDGVEVVPTSPAQMLEHGLAYVSEDRLGLGLTAEWSIRKNLTLPILPSVSLWRRFPIRRKERELAQLYSKKLLIQPPDVERLVKFLSGGNQQKVLLAKWLTVNPKILILDDPTAGIDIGAKYEVYRLITSLAEDGVGVIFISSELPELLAMSDRIVVFCEGRISGRFSAEQATQEAIMKAATDIRLARAQGKAGVHSQEEMS